VCDARSTIARVDADAASLDEVVGREPVDSSVRVPASGIETCGRDSVDTQWVGAKGSCGV